MAMSQNQTDTRSKFDLIICIGDGSLNSNHQSQKIAESLNFPYHLVLDAKTNVMPGVYHTSVYDIKLAQIHDKLKNYRVKIQVLDIPSEAFKTQQDYSDTMMMINDLSKLFLIEYCNEKDRNWFFSQLKDNKAFCVMPFIGVMKRPNSGSHCCHMPNLWQSKTDFFGKSSQEIRQKMLAGTRVPECKFCYDLDDNGVVSDRVSWSYQWATDLKLHSLENLHDNTDIKIYHLDLDNKCNLLCRMCDPDHSNLIAEEYHKLKLEERKEQKNLPESFMQDVDLSRLTKIIVTGGEPTINAKFLNFLESLVGTKHQDLSIIISTNAAVLNRRIKKIADHLPNLKFSISIDGFERVNHYIRWPIDWDKMLQNIDYLYKQKKVSNFKTTISLYNITKLHDLYTWIDSVYPDIPCGMNFVEYPEYMIPWNYPVKSTVFESIEKIKMLSIYQLDQSLQGWISHIESKLSSWVFDQDRLARFYQFNDILDQSRNIALKDYIEPLENIRSIYNFNTCHKTKIYQNL